MTAGLFLRSAALAVLAFAGAAAAQAAPGGVAAAFGNTVVTTYPDGRSQRIWLHPDGSWEGINRKGAALAGQWTLQSEQLCLRQTEPLNLPISYCTDFPANIAPGVQWSGRDLAGRPIRLTLQKGIQRP